jgi:sortase A
MLEDFFENDKKSYSPEERSNSFFMNVVKDIDKFEKLRIENNKKMEEERNAISEVTNNAKSVESKTKKNDALKESILDKYVAVLKIPRINLQKGLFAKKSKYNDVEYNIMIHEASSTPDEEKGNVILVGHSGTADIAFFRNLYKLKKGDIAEIYYHGNKYTYKIVKTYDVEKTGTVEIDRDLNKTSLTMITCRHGTNKQIVLISELVSVTKY